MEYNLLTKTESFNVGSYASEHQNYYSLGQNSYMCFDEYCGMANRDQEDYTFTFNIRIKTPWGDEYVKNARCRASATTGPLKGSMYPSDQIKSATDWAFTMKVLMKKYHELDYEKDQYEYMRLTSQIEFMKKFDFQQEMFDYSNYITEEEFKQELEDAQAAVPEMTEVAEQLIAKEYAKREAFEAKRTEEYQQAQEAKVNEEKRQQDIKAQQEKKAQLKREKLQRRDERLYKFVEKVFGPVIQFAKRMEQQQKQEQFANRNNIFKG